MILRILALVFVSSFALAEEAPLDPPYHFPHLTKHTERVLSDYENDFIERARLPRNDVEFLIAQQSPVRSQGKRGTCSIFSATGLLESLMIINGWADQTVDLSEQWLEYSVNRFNSSGGSNSYINFRSFIENGTPREALYPYYDFELDGLWDPIAQQVCGHVPESLLKNCLVVQRDPRLMDQRDGDLSNPESEFYDLQFLSARKDAIRFRRTVMRGSRMESFLSRQEARYWLGRGVPLTVGLSFYYDSWNHRKTADLGIERNLDHWNRGLVSYPEDGSLDQKMSPTMPAGHSIVLVGYDDDLTFTKTVQMADGTTKEFTYRGVYFFKNSWGTSGFGLDSDIHGMNYPGYGMISQRYVEDYGRIFRLEIQPQ